MTESSLNLSCKTFEDKNKATAKNLGKRINKLIF